MKKIFTTLFTALFAVAIVVPTAANAADKPAYKTGWGNTVYKIHSGDTMWKVSQRFNVNYGKLVHSNPQIENYAFIYPGDWVIIPDHSSDKGNNSDKGNSKDKQEPKDTPTTPKKPQDKQQPGTPSGNENQPNPQPGDKTDHNKKDQNTNGLSQFEQQVVKLTNQERTQRGLPALKVSTELSNMAGVKAQDMRDNNYFDHNSPTYGSPFDMMKQFGISYSYAGENIAAGQRTPQEVVTGWMNSPGHRANILNENYTYIGVGHVEGGSYGHYWVQEFIKK